MTYQSSDSLVFEGEKLRCYDEKIVGGYWLRDGVKPPHWSSPNTACWRGYEASWEIVDKRLYLVDIVAWIAHEQPTPDDPDHKVVSKTNMEGVFPKERGKPIFANWISREVVAFGGEAISYRIPPHPDYEFVHQFRFEAGQLVSHTSEGEAREKWLSRNRFAKPPPNEDPE